MTFGIKPLDALHMAFAESGNADYFCTFDDKLLHQINHDSPSAPVSGENFANFGIIEASRIAKLASMVFIRLERVVE